jgi:hypothetical protein
MGHRFPIKTPEQIQSMDQDDRLVQPDFGTSEWLPDAVGFRNRVAIDEKYAQAIWVEVRQQSLMQVRESERNLGSGAPQPTTVTMIRRLNQATLGTCSVIGFGVTTLRGFPRARSIRPGSGPFRPAHAKAQSALAGVWSTS